MIERKITTVRYRQLFHGSWPQNTTARNSSTTIDQIYVRPCFITRV